MKLGAYYDPSVLPDYGGSYFNHSKARLVQLDVRDVKNNLIPPWKFYEALRPGTLVLCLVSLHCFTMSDDSGKDRKERKVCFSLFVCSLDLVTIHRQVYQMNAHSIRILSESDEYVEQRTRPIAPNSPERAIAAIPRRAVAASFANFTVPALPTVPPASPDLPDLPALPASPAHSPSDYEDSSLSQDDMTDIIVDDRPKKSRRSKRD